MKNYLLFLFPFFLSCLAFGAKPVSLFNGKDLTGWRKANYTVEDGAIVCKGGNLVTEKEYLNYVFEFEFLLPSIEDMTSRLVEYFSSLSLGMGEFLIGMS